MIYRELTPEEFAAAPREVAGSHCFSPENSKILAAINDEGAIVATFTLFYAAHFEPLWIRADYRHHPAIIRRLVDLMKKTLRSIGAQQAYTVVLASTPVLAKVAERLFHAEPVPGTLYLWSDK
jgi:hypothetical protein